MITLTMVLAQARGLGAAFLGWPAGLCLIGLNALFGGPGLLLRRGLMGGAMLLHGGRMLLGGLWLFYPYRWEADLPRYQYAKHRYLAAGLPAAGWPVKMCVEIVAQALANASALAAPAALRQFNQPVQAWSRQAGQVTQPAARPARSGKSARSARPTKPHTPANQTDRSS